MQLKQLVYQWKLFHFVFLEVITKLWDYNWNETHKMLWNQKPFLNFFSPDDFRDPYSIDGAERIHK